MLDLHELAQEYNDLVRLQDEHEDEHLSDDGANADSDCPMCDMDAADRLAILAELDSELGGIDYAARNYGEMIPEDEFEDYARDFAEDCGYLRDDNPLSNYVDWKEWADDMKADYTVIEFEGVDYYVRMD